MLFNVRESDESIQDVINFAIYIKENFKDGKAGIVFYGLKPNIILPSNN